MACIYKRNTLELRPREAAGIFRACDRKPRVAAIEVGPHVGTSASAALTDEQRLDIRQAHFIGPAIGIQSDVTATMAVDQHAAHAHAAHFTEGDLQRPAVRVRRRSASSRAGHGSIRAPRQRACKLSIPSSSKRVRATAPCGCPAGRVMPFRKWLPRLAFPAPGGPARRARGRSGRQRGSCRPGRAISGGSRDRYAVKSAARQWVGPNLSIASGPAAPAAGPLDQPGTAPRRAAGWPAMRDRAPGRVLGSPGARKAHRRPALAASRALWARCRARRAGARLGRVSRRDCDCDGGWRPISSCMIND